MRNTFTFAAASILLFTGLASSAQMKAVVMGSSTAYGSGASTYANSWVGRTEIALNVNPSDGADTIIYNIAQPGYDTYQEMPDSYTPPPGRPLPDMDYNVTKAISLNPDIVIINLPSNDISYGYSQAEMINNLRFMSATIFAAGIRCYVTTPQPRNDFGQSYRDSLRELVDSVNNSFGPYAVDFWNCLVTHDGQNGLRNEYAATPLHLNDDGHEQLFLRIMGSYVFGQAGPVALQLTGFNAQLQNQSVLIKWHTEQQSPNTTFELQRSADGHYFENFYTQTIPGARQSADYTATDQTAFAGKSFYRLKITEAGRQSYSNIISITAPGRSLNISKLYLNDTRSVLNVGIDIQKSQALYVNIISSTGAILSQQQELINQPSGLITIPVSVLPAGQYYIQIITADNNKLSRAFIK